MSNVVIVVTEAGELPAAESWLGVGGSILVLIGAAWVVRARDGEVQPSRVQRIAYSAGTYGLAMALLLAIELIERAAPAFELVGSVVFAALLVIPLAALIITLVDLAAVNSRRTRAWLWRGLIAIPAATVGIWALLFWVNGTEVEDMLDQAAIALTALGAAAALVWWSYLPTVRTGIGDIFE